MNALHPIKNSRKADLTLNTIVIAVLGLVVLIVLIIVFRDQIGSSAQRYFRIGEQAEAGIKGESCASLFSMGRRCSSSQPEDPDYQWESIGRLDCDEGQICWERGERINTQV